MPTSWDLRTIWTRILRRTGTCTCIVLQARCQRLVARDLLTRSLSILQFLPSLPLGNYQLTFLSRQDGPSAGVAFTIAMISMFSGRRVSPTLAMTGEISLRGRVTPVGALLKIYPPIQLYLQSALEGVNFS